MLCALCGKPIRDGAKKYIDSSTVYNSVYHWECTEPPISAVNIVSIPENASIILQTDRTLSETYKAFLTQYVKQQLNISNNVLVLDSDLKFTVAKQEYLNERSSSKPTTIK